MMEYFQNKVVIITGSSSGIGAETAVEFAKLGAKVVLTARRKDKLEQTAQRCQEAGLTQEKILVVDGDITRKEDIENIVSCTVKTFGGINVLVNNAGRSLLRKFEESPVEDLDDMYNVNVRSVYMMTKAALPHLLESKGSIVNVSSIAGINATPYVLTYSMAKAAINQFTQALAIDLAPKGVRVNAVNPGMIQTDIVTQPGMLSPGDEGEFFDRMAAAHPMQRIGQPEEVAKAIMFLASDQASFTTGALFPVDGGRYATMWYPQPKST